MSGQAESYTRLYPYILKASTEKHSQKRQKAVCDWEKVCSQHEMVFPLGVVNKYDVPELQAYLRRASFVAQEQPRGTMRWGTQFLISQKTDNSTANTANKDKHAVRVSYPQVKRISVKACAANLNERPSTAPSKCVTVQEATTNQQTKSKRIMQSIETVAAKNKTTNNEKKIPQQPKKEEIRIENGVIMIENGKFIDLKEDVPQSKHNVIRSNSFSELKKTQQTVQLLDDAMVRLSDARTNLEQEINAEAKTTSVRAKESEFFEQNVKNEFLELFQNVRKKRKKLAKKTKKKGSKKTATNSSRKNKNV